jgi:4-hydroxybenzoate polyprenyltransferase
MLKRISIYLNEMFPISAILGTVMISFAIQMIYLRLHGLQVQFHFQMVLSGIYLTMISLLIRVMDEFKDFEDDKINFPNRPLPSGKVFQSDLKFLGWFCVGTVLLVSVSSIQLFLWSLVSLGFTFLMLKWFFIEQKMRQSLILAFISHHPIVLFNFIYLMLGIIVTFEGVGWSKAGVILPLCLMFTNWEISRKIRSPDQETSYTTYSKILGPRPAILISILLQLIFIFTVFRIFEELNNSYSLKIIFASLMSLMIYPYLKFLFTLKLSSPLKNNAEGEILIVIGFLFASAIL